MKIQIIISKILGQNNNKMYPAFFEVYSIKFFSRINGK